MNNISKTKPLITIIVFLLITNIAMLLFFLFSGKPAERKPKDRNQNGIYNTLQNEVGFSKDQLAQYQSLRKGQMEKVKPLFNRVRKAKKDFYNLLYVDNLPDSLIKMSADSIAQTQKNLDTQMFMYFRSIRNLCTAGQQQKFDSSMNKVVQRMVGGRPGKDNKDHKK